MTDRRLVSAILLAAVASLVCALPRTSFATLRFGSLQVSGNVQSQNLVRHPDATTFEFIQNRNTARIRLDYDWLEGGKWIGKYSLPFVEKSQLSILWRGVYDSVYDTTPGFVEKEDIHGRAYGGLDVFDAATTPGSIAVQKKNGDTVRRELKPDQLELSGLSDGERDAFRFDNQLREAYVDLKFRGVPLSIRAGRQQIVWGETDNFRMLDRANSLDLTWHFQQEIPAPAFGWDEIRRPFWMLKFLYDLDNVWKLSQSYLEWYWNPGDWQPAKQAFLPRPWGLRFSNPLTNPYDGAFFFGSCVGRNRDIVTGGPRRGQSACTRLLNDTKLFGQGDYERNPFENSQVGVRYHGITPQGVEFTLNYFYQRFAGDDGTNYAPLRVLLDTPQNRARAANLYSKGIFPAEAFNPYVHTLGASANYSDETFTQTVFRFETVYDVGVPFFDLQKVGVISTPALPGITKKNMWKGMIAFDRPTWIRSLNKKSTIFLTGQFFWHYLVNNPSCRGPQGVERGAQEIANFNAEGRTRSSSCLTGGLDLPSGIRSASESFRDKIRDWETLFTFAAFTFYRGGSIIPTLGVAVDPTNQWNFEGFWAVDYVVRDDFVVNIGQRYFVTPRGHSDPIFETWGLAGLNQGRSETHLRLTWQF
jgi:hypothetical protein